MIILDGLRLGWLGQGKLVHVLNGRPEGRKTVLFSICNLSEERHPVKAITGSRHLVNATCRGCLQQLFGLTWAGVDDKITEMKRRGQAPSRSISMRIERRREANIRRLRAIENGPRRQRRSRL